MEKKFFSLEVLPYSDNVSSGQFLNLAFLPLGDLGVGIDGGNDKDWEANACKIQLIKKKGKVKALDEEVHSNVLSLVFEPAPLFFLLPSLPNYFSSHILGPILRTVIFKVEGREEK